MNKKKLVLLFIIVFSFILRVYKVNQFPASLYWDEVAIGYNAYSILKTAKDEYGQFLPISFESYQDSKIPGYIYLTVLSQKIFGVNEFSVRLPSIILGTGSVLIMYFVAGELFYAHKRRSVISLISSFLFGITPWSLQFSRAAFEANGGLFFSLLAIYYLLNFLRTNKNLFKAGLTVVISMYFYYQERLFFPPLLLITSLIFYKKILYFKKQIMTASAICIVLVLPILYQSINSSGRLSYVGVFSKPEILEQSIKERIKEGNFLITRLAHNRFIVLGLYIAEGYLKHFSADFLFLNGDPNPRHSVSSQGAFYLWMLPFILLGFVYIYQEKKEIKIVLLSWLLLGPVAASLAVPTPHALRSLLLLPPLIILCSLGLVQSKRFIGFWGIKLFLTIIVMFFAFNYFHGYYVHEKERSIDWADGYKNLYSYLKTKEDNYDKIYVTGKYWRPYIFMLFYNRYDPKLYQQDPNNSRIGKYYFGYASYDTTNPRYIYNQFSVDTLRKTPKTLLALAPEEVREGDRQIYTIYTITGKPVFIIIESNE